MGDDLLVRRKWKRLSAIGTAFIMVMLITAGCTSNNGNTPETVIDATPKPVSTDNSFTISMPYHSTYMSKHPDIDDDPYVKKLEELTNTKLKYKVLPEPFKKSMDLMFASGDLPNVVAKSVGFGSGNGLAVQQALEAGEFLPLDELIDKYGPDLKKFIPKGAWEKETYNGKIYGIPQFITIAERSSTYIRMDLLEKTGLPVPKTVDDMVEVLRAFKKLGVPQPYLGRQNFEQMDTFFGAFDVQPNHWALDTTGNPVPKFFNVENMQRALQTYKTLYDEELMSKEFLTQTKVQYQNTINTGKAGVFQANANNFIPLQTGLAKNVPEARLAIIPAPVGPDGKGGYGLIDEVTRSFAITKKTKNPEVIIQFFNWMLSDEAEKFFTYGLEGIDHTVENGVIKYDPKTDDQIRAESFRAWLWNIQDNTYPKLLLEATPEGRKLIDDFKNIVAKEGRETFRFNPPLTSLDSKPTLNMNGGIPPLVLEAMSKMVIGEKAISDWPTIVTQWKKQGGDAALAEAAEAYKNKAYWPLRMESAPVPKFMEK
jgi:putative aldouronate transport system substrate-binding protein